MRNVPSGGASFGNYVKDLYNARMKYYKMLGGSQIWQCLP